MHIGTANAVGPRDDICNPQEDTPPLEKLLVTRCVHAQPSLESTIHLRFTSIRPFVFARVNCLTGAVPSHAPKRSATGTVRTRRLQSPGYAQSVTIWREPCAFTTLASLTWPFDFPCLAHAIWVAITDSGPRESTKLASNHAAPWQRYMSTSFDRPRSLRTTRLSGLTRKGYTRRPKGYTTIHVGRRNSRIACH